MKRFMCFLSFLILILTTNVKASKLELVSYNNKNINVPIDAGIGSSVLFYDANNDKVLDVIVIGSSQSYSARNSSGGMWLYLNTSGKGGTVFKYNSVAGEYPNKERDVVSFSYLKDGSFAYVTDTGERYSKLSYDKSKDYYNGFDTKTKQTYNKLSGRSYKFYDIDGDGISDAVSLSSSTENTYTIYNSDGSSKTTQKWKIVWLKNTGTNEKPYFENSTFITIKSSKGNDYISKGSNLYRKTNKYGFALFDWDKDGDLDLIAGGYLNAFYYYENVGTSKKPIFTEDAKIVRTTKGNMALSGLRYDVASYDWDGDGYDDLFLTGESGTVQYFRFNHFDKEKNTVVFDEGKYLTANARYISKNSLSRVTTGDLDNDGDLDMIIGEDEGRFYYLENLSGPNVEKPSWTSPSVLKDTSGKEIVIKAGKSGSLRGTHESEWGYTNPSLGDMDNDGDLDIVFNSITGRIMWIENKGTKANAKWASPVDVKVDWGSGGVKKPSYLTWDTGNIIKSTDLIVQHRSSVNLIDINNDGRNDLVVMDADGYLACYTKKSNGHFSPSNSRIFYYKNNGTYQQLRFKDVNKISNLLKNDPDNYLKNIATLGRYKFTMTDWNMDGKLDLIMATDMSTGNDKVTILSIKYSNPYLFFETEKIENGKYYFKSPVTIGNKENISGHNFNVAVTDFDGDMVPDLVTGTESGYIYYYRNDNKSVNDKITIKDKNKVRINSKNIIFRPIKNGEFNRNTFLNSVGIHSDSITFKNANGTTITNNSTFGTGSTIHLSNTKYTIIVSGDINGDGKVTTNDYVLIRKHLLKSALLSNDIKITAADINNDNKISVSDYSSIRKVILGIS